MVDTKVNLEALLDKKDGKKAINNLKFESGMEVLEQLVSKVESGSMPLDKAVDAYEAASDLVKHLRSLLGDAEGKLKILQENSAGNISIKDS
ncbi:MAG: exodeoxyribonuclease VII small subunit [bacterium]|nr:exodeoxyribonuclease VII small subunit [bacterium]